MTSPTPMPAPQPPQQTAPPIYAPPVEAYPPPVAQPEPYAPSAAEALESEVAAEGAVVDFVPDGYVRVPLGDGATVRALVPSRWRASHLRCLNRNDLDALATGTDDDPSGQPRPGILHEEDVAIWFDVDPTQDEISDWFEALTEAGEALGKSSGRSRSMNRTRRR